MERCSPMSSTPTASGRADRRPERSSALAAVVLALAATACGTAAAGRPTAGTTPADNPGRTAPKDIVAHGVDDPPRWVGKLRTQIRAADANGSGSGIVRITRATTGFAWDHVTFFEDGGRDNIQKTLGVPWPQAPSYAAYERQANKHGYLTAYSTAYLVVFTLKSRVVAASFVRGREFLLDCVANTPFSRRRARLRVRTTPSVHQPSSSPVATRRRPHRNA